MERAARRVAFSSAQANGLGRQSPSSRAKRGIWVGGWPSIPSALWIANRVLQKRRSAQRLAVSVSHSRAPLPRIRDVQRSLRVLEHWNFAAVHSVRAVVRWWIAKVQNSGAPLQNPSAPVHCRIAQLQSSSAPVQSARAQLQNSGAPLQNPGAPVRWRCAQPQNSSAPVQSGGAPLQNPSVQVRNPGAPMQNRIPPSPDCAEGPYRRSVSHHSNIGVSARKSEPEPGGLRRRFSGRLSRSRQARSTAHGARRLLYQANGLGKLLRWRFLLRAPIHLQLRLHLFKIRKPRHARLIGQLVEC